MDNQNNTFKSEAEIMETIAAVTPVESSADDAPLIQPVKPEPMVPPVPEKKEVNVVAIVLGVIAGIFAIVAIVFIVKYFTEKPKCEVEAAVQELSEAEKEKITNNVMVKEYNEVYDLMEELISRGNGRYFNYDGGFLYTRVDDTNVFVETKLSLSGEAISSEDTIDADMAAVGSDLVAVGFENIGTFSVGLGAKAEVHMYYNSETATICNVYKDDELVYGDIWRNYVYFDCGKTSWTWLTDEETELIGELGAAYQKKSGDTSSIAMSTQTISVVNSKYEPYQTARVAFGGGVGEFYRTSPDSEWQYFSGGQTSFDCSEYNTDDLRKAFLGEPCYENGAQSTVRL